MTAEQGFKGEIHRVKAMHMLHYLATGQVNAREYEMILNKILCGYPVDDPISHSIQLTEQELTEAKTLTEEIIRHWKILKDISVDGFRDSFLQRNGRLVEESSGWLLMVEQKAYDMLLDKLPWGISTIKLPWMRSVLHVEWR